MKKIILGFFLAFVIASALAQNVGIGTTMPSQKFTVRQDGIGVTQENVAGTVQLGFYTNSFLAYLQTHTNHPLAFTTNNGFPQMYLSTAGNFGIGNIDPNLAGLVVDKKIGAVNALFGSNTAGVAIESNYPGIGLNTYYGAGRKSISAGYGGWMGLDPNTGDLIFQSSATAGTAGSDINLTTKLQINKDGLVGIGTAALNPTAQLHVDVGTSTTNGLLVTGTYNNISSTLPNLGAGSRLMFYPGRGAFRAGYVSGAQWNSANVGFLSTAMGYNTTARGNYSTAMGYNTVADVDFSIAMGNSTTASGQSSTAMGYFTDANGVASTAMGYSTLASGNASTAIGNLTTASGAFSTAMGSSVNTNNKTGAFAIGDSDPNNEGSVSVGLADQFVARFWNGYYLLTSGNNTRYGVSIDHNGNAWVSICDSNRKENLEPLNGESVLKKLSNINFHSWNYKQQACGQYRHYGIMAQDFYAAFGQDSYGTIGNDTTVNPIDMIGVDMAAIKALEKRTSDLKSQNEELNLQNEKLEGMINKLEERLKKLEGGRK